MGRVILGMPGPWAKNLLESSDHYTTKIGGLPDWPTLESFMRPGQLNCLLCGERLCLLAQVYAPISSPSSNITERVVYIFGCIMAKCGSSPKCWRALRLQKCNGYGINQEFKASTNCMVEDKHLGSEKGACLEENIICDNGEDIEEACDFDFDELARELSEVSFQAFQSKKQKDSLILQVPNKCIHSNKSENDIKSSIPVVPCFYIYLQEDQSFCDIASVATYAAPSVKQDVDSLNDDKEEEVWEGEGYEYDKALGADRTYLKFKKRMDAYPEQCFRYSNGGTPLLAKPELKEVNPCDLCGSPRQYEMQLMPPLLYFLHEASDSLSASLLEEWNWMTLLVYTCSSNCCPSSCSDQLGSCCWAVAEEAVIVQDD